MERSFSPRKKNAGSAGDKKSGRGGKSVKGSGDGQPGKVDQMGNRAERAEWSDIWKYTALQLQFLLRAVYDVLPTPTI